MNAVRQAVIHAAGPFGVHDAITHYERGELAQADAICRQALRERPHNIEALNILGTIKARSGRTAEAVELFERAVAVQPADARSHNNLGNALAEVGRLEEALPSYERALSIAPNFIDARHNRGRALLSLGRFAEALVSFDLLLERNPTSIAALIDRGHALCSLGRPTTALQSFDQAITLNPGNPTALVNKAHACLLMGDYEAGWPFHEARYYAHRRKVSAPPSCFSQRHWLGVESLEGKTIFLYAEQGLGDTLQFCRYVPMVAARGAKVILEVQHPCLVPILGSLDGVGQLITRQDPMPERFDYHASLMSLPLAFNTTLTTIPSRPYLKADPVKVGAWRERLGPSDKLRVGLVWAGAHRPFQPETLPVNSRRNIPLTWLAPLKHSRVEFYSLQVGEAAENELASLQDSDWDGPEITSYVGEFRDWSDTAALVENLDLVISVDTSTAHLTGALGKPFWLLNRFDTCWRWMLERTDSLWYPSATIYRQDKPGDWGSVVQRVAADLRRAALQLSRFQTG
jgi:Flp pilus assembly protein TadD